MIYLASDLFVFNYRKFEDYKVQKKQQIIKNGKFDWESYQMTCRVAIANQIFVGIPLATVIAPIVIHNDIPLDYGFMNAVRLGLLMVPYTVIADFIFYIVHRTLHIPIFYRMFHKFHHQWTAPFATAAIYVHPIEHLLANSCAAIAPFIILRIEWSFCLFLILYATCLPVIGHSGYKSRIKLFDSSGHDIHHELFNYNYGSNYSVFDRIFGTLKKTD